jgi:hypothetical protein
MPFPTLLNPFKNPTGFLQPGLHTEHVAWSNSVRLSCLPIAPTGAVMTNFVDGIHSSIAGNGSGNPVATLTGFGEGITFGTTADGCLTFPAIVASESITNFTAACIFTVNASQSFGIPLLTSSSAPGSIAGIWMGAGAQIEVAHAGAVSNITGFPTSLVVGATYFVAISAQITGTGFANGILVDLRTGQKWRGNVAITGGTAVTAGATYGVGGSTASGSKTTIYAAMFSTSLLSARQLDQWSFDPWGFWYLPDLEQIFKNSTASNSGSLLSWFRPFEHAFRNFFRQDVLPSLTLFAKPNILFPRHWDDTRTRRPIIQDPITARVIQPFGAPTVSGNGWYKSFDHERQRVLSFATMDDEFAQSTQIFPFIPPIITGIAWFRQQDHYHLNPIISEAFSLSLSTAGAPQVSGIFGVQFTNQINRFTLDSGFEPVPPPTSFIPPVFGLFEHNLKQKVVAETEFDLPFAPANQNISWFQPFVGFSIPPLNPQIKVSDTFLLTTTQTQTTIPTQLFESAHRASIDLSDFHTVPTPPSAKTFFQGSFEKANLLRINLDGFSPTMQVFPLGMAWQRPFEHTLRPTFGAGFTLSQTIDVGAIPASSPNILGWISEYVHVRTAPKLSEYNPLVGLPSVLPTLVGTQIHDLVLKRFDTSAYSAWNFAPQIGILATFAAHDHLLSSKVFSTADSAQRPIFTTPPVPVSGMSWQRPFDNPLVTTLVPATLNLSFYPTIFPLTFVPVIHHFHFSLAHETLAVSIDFEKIQFNFILDDHEN